MKTQNTTKHTPAPWTFRTVDDQANIHHLFDGTGSLAAQITLTALCKGNAQADMRLIAAAPTMIAALKRISIHLRGKCDHDTMDDCNDAVGEIVLDAIAQAEGRE